MSCLHYAVLYNEHTCAGTNLEIIHTEGGVSICIYMYGYVSNVIGSYSIQ